MTPSALYSSPIGFSSLFAFCGLPLRVDTYKGCAFGCSYCFARARETVSGSPDVRAADESALERLFHRALLEERDDLSIIGKCIQQRMPIQLGAMGDPFQPVEKRFNVSLRYLQSCRRFSYPVVISTRSSLVAEPPYLDLLRDLPSVVVRLSLSTTIDGNSSLIENRGVRPSDILRTMHKLRSAGIHVACRWQPFIPGLSEEPEVFARTIAAAGAEQCSFEFLRLPRERSKKLTAGYLRATGVDILQRYKEAAATHRVREYILPPEKRLSTILRARAAIHSYGMRFGSADNDFQYLSDSACCCSGVDVIPGFEKFFKHQIAFAVRQSVGRRTISFSVIEREWAPDGSVDRYLNSGRRLGSKQQTVRAHIARRWNSSGLEGSPDSFFGVEKTDQRSVNGMQVYKWIPEFSRIIGEAVSH